MRDFVYIRVHNLYVKIPLSQYEKRDFYFSFPSSSSKLNYLGGKSNEKKFVPGIASVVGVSILLTGCGSYKNEASGANAKDEAPSKQVLNLSSPTEIRTMDTARATDTDSGQVMRNVFEGLYNLGEGNKPFPGVAKSHEVSGDKTKYTFHLRDSKWSKRHSCYSERFCVRLAESRRSSNSL